MARSDTADDRIYCFGEYRFMPGRQLLLRGEEPVRIGGRALDLLHLLVRHAGEVVTKKALVDFAWPDTFVHESNLKVNIAALRRALPRASAGLPYIATVPGRGYRFVAPLRVYGRRDLDVPPALASPAGAGALPSTPAVIGRDKAIAAIGARLVAGGFLTVVGAAGVGKTTVAVAAAARLTGRYRDGVRFVDLAAIGDPQLVAAAIAHALGAGPSLSDRLASLVEVLRDREMLLVLDNCEHVRSAAAAIAEHLRLALPGLHILATSREPLRSQAESVHRLAALPFPAEEESGLDAAAAHAFPAVALFVRRAAETHGYRFADGDAPLVAAICRRLDGVALAIELAASRLSSDSPATLLDRLALGFDMLNAPSDRAPPRQRTLLATLDWSYRLLSPDEARLLRILSVFAGPFAIDDVTGVAGRLGVAAEEAASSTQELSAKSLLSATYDEGGPRYRLLDSTRSFAADRLRDGGEQPAAAAAHAAHLLQVFEQAEADWQWRAREDWTQRYAPRANDLRRAIDWAFAPGGDPRLGVRLTVAAIPLWDELSSVGESRRRVAQALRAAEPAEAFDATLRMKLVAAHASGLNFSDRLGPEVDAAWTEGWRLAREVGNVDYQLRTVWCLAVLETFTGRHRRALATLDRFDAILAGGKDRSARPDGERLRLMTRFYCGDIRGAQEGLERLSSEHDRIAHRARVARFQLDRFVAIRNSLALITWVAGDRPRALALTREALDGAESLGHLVSQSNALAQTALPLAVWAGDLDGAEAQVATLFRNLALRDIGIWGAVGRFYQGAIASARGDPAGVEAMHAAIDGLIATNLLVRLPMHLAMLGEAALTHDRLDLARSSLAEAVRRAGQQDERWCRPELLRLRGLIEAADGDRATAAASLQQAMQAAEESGALTFRERAAASLTSLATCPGARLGAGLGDA